MSSNLGGLLLATGLISFLHLTYAQVGVTICACQPDFYEFTLNFSLTCDDRDITSALPGINDTACKTNPVGNQNVTDKTPVVVTQVQILELGQASDVLFETTLDASYGDLSTFNYTSVAAQPDTITENNLPAGLQLTITGRNQNEQEIINYWLIVYDNDCGIWPLLTEGQKIGWTIFSSLGTPSQFLCPVAPFEGTSTPSKAPSQLTPVPGLPSFMPTFKPSFAGPSSSKNSPTIRPSFAGPSSSKASPSSQPAPTSLCPPLAGDDDEPPRGSKGSKKVGIKGSRSLHVGSHTNAPSECPEQPPQKKSKGAGSKSTKKKSKGGGSKSSKAKSKGDVSKSSKTKSKGNTSKATKKKSKGDESKSGGSSAKHGMAKLSKPHVSRRARRKF